MHPFEERITVRNKNQITIPKTVADARHIEEGTTVIVQIDDARPDEILLRVLPGTYAGALTEAFAGIDAGRFVERERAGWE